MPNIRKRRFPYTTVACANCQRRKTKCSGEKPCKSCSDSGVSCVYERSSRFRSGSGSGARPCLITTSGRHGREKSLTQPPQPSSSDYYLRLAEKRLIALSPEQSDSRQDCPIEVHTVGASSVRRLVEHRRRGSPGGVLAVFDTRTWVNILRKYNEEVGLQYPFVDLDELKRDICNLATSPSSRHERQNEEEEMAAAQGLNQFHPESPNEQICILILTIIATLAEYDATKLANPIVEDVFKDVAIKTQLKSVNESDLSLLILISIYFFLSDREILAWRGIGNVLRLIQELNSTNRESSSGFALSSNQSTQVNEKLFWSAYTLDRRWSFGTNLPFAIQDSDIHSVPRFEDGSLSSVYMRQMILFCGIASEVRNWLAPNHGHGAAKSPLLTGDSTCDFLNFRVIQWQQNLPECIRFMGIQETFDSRRENRGEYKLRLTVYLRANLMRTVIYRKWASRTDLSSHTTTANTMREIAQDTVRVLVKLARETDIYRSQQRTFNHFLETALSSLLLTLCSAESIGSRNRSSESFHNPTRKSCLHDIRSAMELVAQLSVSSPITLRLQEKLKGIRGVLEEIEARDYASPSDSTTIQNRWDLSEADGLEHSTTQEGDIHPPTLTSPEDSQTAGLHNGRTPQIVRTPQPPSLESLFTSVGDYDSMSNPAIRPVSLRGTAEDEQGGDQIEPRVGWLPSDMYTPQAVDCAIDDFYLQRYPELGDMLKDYESFTF
ncbi:hypothetical protein V2G26_016600 [Clonostachys chloroleuca]